MKTAYLSTTSVFSSPLKLLYNILQVFLFVLFCYATVGKINTFDLFVNNLEKSLFFEDYNVYILALIIVGIEGLIPLLIFFPVTEKLGYIAAFLLFFLFTGYILMMKLYSPFMPCSCGGLIEKLSWNGHIVFNIFGMAASLYLSLASFKNGKG